MCGLWSPSARPSVHSKECWVLAGVTGRQDPVESDIHLTNVFLQRSDQSWGGPRTLTAGGAGDRRPVGDRHVGSAGMCLSRGPHRCVPWVHTAVIPKAVVSVVGICPFRFPREGLSLAVRT